MRRTTGLAAAAAAAVVLGIGVGWMFSSEGEPAPTASGGQGHRARARDRHGRSPSQPPAARATAGSSAAIIPAIGRMAATPQASGCDDAARRPGPAAVASSCENPDALGISRTVAIDTAGGPGFGSEQFKAYDFLEPGEVVLTFDDGPWPSNTPAVLAALAAQCVKATFFPIGQHSSWHPEHPQAGRRQGSHRRLALVVACQSG